MPRFYGTGVYGPAETVWHSDDDCPVLAKVPAEDRIEGPQEDRDKCPTCERMHQAKVAKMKFYNQ